MKKSMLSMAVSSALGLGMTAMVSAAPVAITGMTIEDIGSNTMGGGGYASQPDGISGAFAFSTMYLSLTTYPSANFFTGDVSSGVIFAGSAPNSTGSFTTGFLFLDEPFVPFTFNSVASGDNNFAGTIDDGGTTGDVSDDTLNITDLGWGANFVFDGITYNVPMQPDTQFPLQVGVLQPRANGTDWDVVFRWGHDFTTADDPTGVLTGFSAQWVLEGCLTTRPSGKCAITDNVLIEVIGGTPQECTATGGTDISVIANIEIEENDAVASVTWLLNGETVATGEAAEIFVPLGTHRVIVNLETVLGVSASAAESIVIEDTIAPEINAAFLNPKTGAEITSIKSRNKADISISVNDICDPTPASSATTGIPTQDGDTVAAKTSKRDSSVELSVMGNADNIELTVTAEDASGNMSSDKAQLIVTQ